VYFIYLDNKLCKNVCDVHIVHEYLCIHTYKLMCKYMCKSAFRHIFVLYINEVTCTYTHTHLHLKSSIKLNYIIIYIYVFIYIYIHVNIYTPIYICIFSNQIYIHVYIYVYINIHMYINIYKHEKICMYMYV
jgi:hypothetical protein